jgi:tetratricopeptide (TPR) repeat protein
MPMQAANDSAAATQPGAARAQFELASKAASRGDINSTIEALRQATRLDPAMSAAWRALGETLARAGDAAGADAAYAAYVRAAGDDAELVRAAQAVRAAQWNVAESLLKARLHAIPTDIVALRMMAETCIALGRFTDAEGLLTCVLGLAPSFAAARHNLAFVLFRLGKAALAVPHVERLLLHDPRNASYRTLLASSLAMTGRYDRAIEIYQGILAEAPRETPIWLSYGNALRHLGRRADAVRAYRTCIDIAPTCGEAYWSLANLKTEIFSAADIAAMRTQLAASGLAEADRVQLHYALGSALERQGAFAESFAHYAAGSRLKRSRITYSADETSAKITRAAAFFNADFFAARAGAGCQNAAPIFIVGLPRAGSTLIEQILSSHSDVEGTMELPEMTNIVRDLVTARGAATGPYSDILAALDPDEFAALGERYIERTGIYRQTKKPFYIDKLPENWAQIGLIQLILPRAKIIDARRDPMATCFSNFKQYYPFGQDFSYDLTELGRYYSDYVRLVAHFEATLPGRLHRVQHEHLVADTETELRRLLDFCGLAFQPACLRFWETERAVHTSSSEQVRRPIFRDGLDQWRHYEPWLGPLREAIDTSRR